MAIDSRVDAVEKHFPDSDESVLFGLAPTAVELALPHAAPLLKFVELIRSHFSAKERQERAVQFLAILRDHERLLEVLGTKFDTLNVKIEDLAEAVQIATWRDVDAFNDAKRDRYARIIGNAVRSEDQIDDLAAFIRDVEMLGEADITVLKVLNTFMNQSVDWKDQFGNRAEKVHPNTFIQRRQEMARRIAEALGQKENLASNSGQSFFSKEEGYSICARLQGFGLAHEVGLSAREVPLGDYCFRPSKRGLMLLKLLGESVENWSQYFPPGRK